MLSIAIIGLLLTGCGEVKTVQGLEYVQTVKSKWNGGMYDVIFKDQNGQMYIFHKGTDDMLSLLEEGRRYDITATIGDDFTNPDMITNIKLSQ
jgi:hypothetical protein